MLSDGVARAFQLERFQEFLALEQGSSPRTLEAYGHDLGRLAQWSSMRGAGSPAELTPVLLREFVYHLKDIGLSPSSIRRCVSAVRTYFKFLIGDGQLRNDPSERLETPKKWFKANVDAVMQVYGPQCRIQKEDLFLGDYFLSGHHSTIPKISFYNFAVIGGLDALDHALFVSHKHPDGQVGGFLFIFLNSH